MTVIDSELNWDLVFDHDIMCETVWHERWGWEPEKAEYVVDGFLPACQHSTNNVLVGQRCVDHLLADSEVKFRCQQCGTVGNYLITINPL